MKENRHYVNRVIVVIILCIFFSGSAWAQKGWELGGSAGITYYFGDLNTRFSLKLPGATAGILAQYNYNSRVSLRFGAHYSLLRGDDANSTNLYEKARNLSFRSHVAEGQAMLQFNFLPFTHGKKEEMFTPYVFLGLNFFYFQPQAAYQGEWVNLRPLGTEGQFLGEEYFSINGGAVYGGGFKVSLDYKWSLFVEVMARATFTDYLDDVSTTYPNQRDLQRLRGDVAVALSDRSVPIPGFIDGPIGEEGRQRGESRTKDNWASITIGLTYYFGSLRCPEYGRPRGW